MSPSRSAVALVECPRDAMQGLAHFVPTDLKVRYLNALLRVGFDTLDFGSFVSAKAIPHLRDTAEVVQRLDLTGTPTKLLAIVANARGAVDACQFAQITYLGFPLSVSETFQRRNVNQTIAQALDEVRAIQELCVKHGKTLVVYLSMGFGNPYGEVYHPGMVGALAQKLVTEGITILAPSDTVGTATPAGIGDLFGQLIPAFPGVTFGAHLHATPGTEADKLAAAYRAGCRRFDGALRGYGGCPMAADALTGNLATERIVDFLTGQRADVGLNPVALAEASALADAVFAGD